NNAYMVDDHTLDPAYPESLVFRRLPDGSRRLEAAMFYLRDGIELDEVDPAIAWLPGWHVHEDLCVTDDNRFDGFPYGGTCTTGKVETRLMMHVWITDNPCGHRFSGLGVGGIWCGDHDGPHHPTEPTYPTHPTHPNDTRPVP